MERRTVASLAIKCSFRYEKGREAGSLLLGLYKEENGKRFAGKNAKTESRSGQVIGVCGAVLAPGTERPGVSSPVAPGLTSVGRVRTQGAWRLPKPPYPALA
jgi:hypothetical protein